MIKIIKAEKVDTRHWDVLIKHDGIEKVWNFKRREFLDVNGNPVYEIYPDWSDVENGIPTNTNIGRVNSRKKCYRTLGAGSIQNIGLSYNMDLDRTLKHTFSNFYDVNESDIQGLKIDR